LQIGFSASALYPPNQKQKLLLSTQKQKPQLNPAAQIDQSLADLIDRVEKMELAQYYSPEFKELPDKNTHEQVIRANSALIKSNIFSSVKKWVPDNYYSLSLSDRASILGAGSTYQLCKSMLMENKAYDKSCSRDEKNGGDQTYARYYLVIVQYEAAIATKKLQSEVRALRPVNERLDPSKFEFRIALEEENDKLTGYSHNAVTPFGMLSNSVPIILAKSIQDNENMCKFIWMGGGHMRLKIGVNVAEFRRNMNALVMDISNLRVGNSQNDDFA